MAPSVSASQIERLQAYYRRHGCSPEIVADDMLRAVIDGRDFVLSGPYARLVHHARRLSIRLVRTLMLRSARDIGYL